MKKIIYLLILLLIVVISGCSNNKTKYDFNKSVTAPVDPARFTYEQIIDESDFICIGTLLGTKTIVNLNGKEDSLRYDYLEFHFQVLEIVFSKYSFEKPLDIYVYSTKYSNISSYEDVSFETGVEYMLPLSLSNQSIYSVNDVYTLNGAIILALDNDKVLGNRMGLLKQEIEAENGDNYSKRINKESIISYINELKTNDNEKSLYYKERNKDTIYEYSKNIFEIKLKEKRYEFSSSVLGKELYSFKIIKKIKGDVDTDLDLVVILPKDFAKKGDTLIVSLDNGLRKYYSETEYFYNLSVNIDLNKLE